MICTHGESGKALLHTACRTGESVDRCLEVISNKTVAKRSEAGPPDFYERISCDITTNSSDPFDDHLLAFEIIGSRSSSLFFFFLVFAFPLPVSSFLFLTCIFIVSYISIVPVFQIFEGPKNTLNYGANSYANVWVAPNELAWILLSKSYYISKVSCLNHPSSVSFLLPDASFFFQILYNVYFCS